MGAGLGGGGLKIGAGGAVLLLVLSLVTGQNFFAILGDAIDTGAPDGQVSAPSSEDEPMVQFVSFVLDDVQNTWGQKFPVAARDYRKTKLVLFTDNVSSGCGYAQSAMGPFYCPADEKVYIDLGFYRELRSRFGAPGDFAQAYVIAHEIGHHIQSELGIEEQIRRKQQDDSSNANKYSVQLELQADCFAGVWGKSTYDRGLLDPGDVEEGLKAAAAVGDDRLGARSREQWTHGSSALRTQWFKTGFDSGNAGDCDTSNVDF